MFKVIFFALLAIGLGSCGPIEEADGLYNSLLPEGGPMFEISDENTPQKLSVHKEGSNGLVFQVGRSNAEVTFKYHDKVYLLHSIKYKFNNIADDAKLELQFQMQNPTSTSINIVITTIVSGNVELAGNVGMTAEPISVEMIKYLLTSKKSREKDTVMSIQWVAELIKKKRPMFYEVRRGPVTMVFVSPPIIINADVFQKLKDLKDKMKAPIGQQFMKIVAPGGSRKGLTSGADPMEDRSKVFN